MLIFSDEKFRTFHTDGFESKVLSISICLSHRSPAQPKLTCVGLHN